MTEPEMELAIKGERRDVIFDAIQAGVLATVVTVFAIRHDIAVMAIAAALLGARLSSIASRYRVIRWMRIVQSQDAVIEQLLKSAMEEIPPPRPQAPRGPKNGRI